MNAPALLWWKTLWARLLGKLAGKLHPKGGEIYYINGADALPPPLSPQQEAAIMEAICRGEEPSREPLITHNCGWWGISRKNSSPREPVRRI